MKGGSLGIDAGRMSWYVRKKNFLKIFEESEYVRRLFNQKRDTWEGNTWIIDLLPHAPREAIAAIEAYDLAHYYLMPDGRVRGHSEAAAVIRAKYLDATTDRQAIDSMTPRDFEYLVAALYRVQSYEVRVTRQTRDDGFDILATKEAANSRERLLVECKHGETPIAVGTARALSGVLDSMHATRGVLVSTSRFTGPAIAFAKKTARVELVDYGELCARLNAELGLPWASRLTEIVTKMKADLTPAKIRPDKKSRRKGEPEPT